LRKIERQETISNIQHGISNGRRREGERHLKQNIQYPTRNIQLKKEEGGGGGKQ